MTTQNARFWDYVNDSWVKITLRPGQQLHHSYGGPTEEGYRWGTTSWEHEGDRVVEIDDIQSRDCDGRMDTHGEYACPLEELNGRPSEFSPVGRVPNWKRVSSRQRDYSAEAAGY